LTLVYSVDLPQVDELEHYRPSTTTQLYDVHGRIFGSFALERRVVVNYDDFAHVLRQASSPPKIATSRATGASTSSALPAPPGTT